MAFQAIIILNSDLIEYMRNDTIVKSTDTYEPNKEHMGPEILLSITCRNNGAYNTEAAQFQLSWPLMP